MKEAKMKALHVLIAICFSASAFAQDASPEVGGKPLVQVNPKTPQGCKLVGTVKGTKLWLATAQRQNRAAPPLRRLPH
jgi:hypothetical protein